jgi:hypothetical protein
MKVKKVINLIEKDGGYLQEEEVIDNLNIFEKLV